MGKIFISYRRDDSASDSGRIDDKLAPHYGRANVFKDVDTIPLGVDFRQVLTTEVAKCDVMLVVIGRQWVSVIDERGKRRLDNPSDFVRIEVEAALARNIPVIPVLMQNVPMPQERNLPASLAPLAFRNSIAIRSDPYFHQDMDLLIRRLDSLFNSIAPLPTASHSAVGHQPSGTQPITLPFDKMPPRLSELGFASYLHQGVACILPPTCLVPAGPFLMGSDKSKDLQAGVLEEPQHSITLSAFRIAKYPVTVAEYACFVRAGQDKPSDWKQQERNMDHPVVFLSKGDAIDYAEWLAKLTGQVWRLPGEAEWEKAARGTDGRIYPWGDEFAASHCNARERGKEHGTSPVGNYPTGASPYGALDMAGNVWEYATGLNKDYPYTPTDVEEQVTSPAGNWLRGGSHSSLAQDVRVARRNPYLLPVGLSGDRGFRLVLVVPNI
jgi:formylglycine-generating enzyme required for sulfatase activity